MFSKVPGGSDASLGVFFFLHFLVTYGRVSSIFLSGFLSRRFFSSLDGLVFVSLCFHSYILFVCIGE